MRRVRGKGIAMIFTSIENVADNDPTRERFVQAIEWLRTADLTAVNVRLRQEIAERYEFCEDLAHMLEDQAKAVLFDLGISEDDVLERIQAGLCGGAAGVTPGEAWWVSRRLAELLGWDGSRLAPPPDGA